MSRKALLLLLKYSCLRKLREKEGDSGRDSEQGGHGVDMIGMDEDVTTKPNFYIIHIH